MNKIISLVIVGCIIIIGGYLMWSRYSQSKGNPPIPLAGEVSTVPTTTQAAEQPTTPAAEAPRPKSPTSAPTPKPTKTFHTLFTQSGSHECDFDQVSSAGSTSHRIYVAGGKMRGEFRSSTGVGGKSTLMVYDGFQLYTWTEGTTHGTISDLTSISQLPVAIPSDLTSGASYGTNTNNVGWNCHVWIKDASMLTPPSYVKFSR